jgi:hypothetical protein
MPYITYRLTICQQPSIPAREVVCHSRTEQVSAVAAFAAEHGVWTLQVDCRAIRMGGF